MLGIDLSGGRTGDQSIHSVFVDPGGSHCIATIVGEGGAETFYIHAKWSKPRVLSKLKGLLVNAVAWNRQHITEGTIICFLVLNFGVASFPLSLSFTFLIYMEYNKVSCTINLLFHFSCFKCSFNEGNYSWYRQWSAS